MTLISNLSKNFSDSFFNADKEAPELKDLSSALDAAIAAHVVSPASNSAFLSKGFGNTWKLSFKIKGQPTEEMTKVCEYINSNIQKPISNALGNQIKNCSTLMAASPPPVAQGSVPVVNAALATFPGGQAIAATMNASVASATSSGNLAGIPTAVSLALSQLSSEIAKDDAISLIQEIQVLDYQLEIQGLSGAKKMRKDAWKLANPDVLSIAAPKDIYPSTDGKKFWDAILQAIAESIPS
jgi:hypothetical protein